MEEPTTVPTETPSPPEEAQVDTESSLIRNHVQALPRALRQGDLFVLFLVLLTIKFIFDNFVQFGMLTGVIIVTENVKVKYTEQVSLKGSFDLKVVMLNLVTCILLLRLLFGYVPWFLEDQNFFLKRFTLHCEMDNKYGFMEILWSVTLTECAVVLCVLSIKILIVLIAFFPLPRFASSYVGHAFLGSVICCAPRESSTNEVLADIESGRPILSDSRHHNSVRSSAPAAAEPSPSSALESYEVSITSLLQSAIGDRINLGRIAIPLRGNISSPITHVQDLGGVVLSSESTSLPNTVHFRRSRADEHTEHTEPCDIQTTNPNNHSNNSSDADEGEAAHLWKVRQELDVMLVVRRILTCVDCSSLLFRNLLPVPLWFVFLHRGSFAGALFLPTVYLLLKGYSLTWVCAATIEAFVGVLNRKLEFGHFSTPAELATVEECSICYDTPFRPVTLNCSHIFCEGCIIEWADRERSCPLCRCSLREHQDAQDVGMCGAWRNLSWLVEQPNAFSAGRLF